MSPRCSTKCRGKKSCSDSFVGTRSTCGVCRRVCVTVCVCVGVCRHVPAAERTREKAGIRGPLGHVHRLRGLHMSSVRCALCGRVEGCATQGRLGAESTGALLGVEWNGNEPCHMETGSS